MCEMVCILAKPWTILEKEAVMRKLGYLLKMRRVPRQVECLNAIAAEPDLINRDWRAIKNHMASKIRYARLREQRD